MLDKNNRLIALLTRGDYFGEVPALLNLRRMAKTMAVTWCELLRLDYVRATCTKGSPAFRTVSDTQLTCRHDRATGRVSADSRGFPA